MACVMTKAEFNLAQRVLKIIRSDRTQFFFVKYLLQLFINVLKSNVCP